ncbi:MarR family winged helix-turn-helix transcriptional regulator [Treponema sp.]|uniref:MarR family winged helix-turn-helix transcriptional regulator n=1 Tax=Treponema sp. TaxID=166 RepID=UPI0025FC5546|nr:MarR family transcriptional regulator [Treponema sp.]MCR5217114.1 MarR family transcriptional regulator [Treponema sp.]
MSDTYDSLKLENQLCFPLYACSKEIIRKYKPYLDDIDLTYTQYITMMVFWEYKKMNVKELGQKLYLDSGTLTPLLKKLESKELITRERSKDDERNLIVKITPKGEELIERAKSIPEKMSCCVALSKEEAQLLYKVLHKILGTISE